MGVVAFVLLACALVLIAGVEWPRVSARVGSDARAGRKGARRKEGRTGIGGGAGRGGRRGRLPGERRARPADPAGARRDRRRPLAAPVGPRRPATIASPRGCG